MNSMNGSMVILRTNDTIFMRIPRELQQPINGGCCCDYCKAHPKQTPCWDTFAVAVKAPKKGNDYGFTCHMPDPISAREAHARLNAKQATATQAAA